MPSSRGSSAQLREAFMNLVLNAVDALTSGGTIVLRTRAEDERVVVEGSDVTPFAPADVAVPSIAV